MELTEQAVLGLFDGKKVPPLNKVQIGRELKVPADRRNELRGLLRRLEREGKLVRTRGERFTRPKELGLRKGRFDGKEGGFGFLIPDDPDAPDVYLASNRTGVAMHGDRILVRLRHPHARRTKPDQRGKGKKKPEPQYRPGERVEGEVVKVLERAHEKLVGTIKPHKGGAELIPDDARIVNSVLLVPKPGEDSLPPREELQNKKAVVKLLEWENPFDPLTGYLDEILGDLSDPEVAMEAIIRKYGLPQKFPEGAIVQAEETPEEISRKERDERLDLREELIVTIDPVGAKDHDDAIHVRALSDGWEVGVHIADVSHYVTENSPIDLEARKRGNSVYLADRVIPMIPPRLSNVICSLQDGVDRCARSVLLRIDKQGRYHDIRFAKSVIRSRASMTYAEALELLEKPDGSDLAKMLKAAWDCASLLRKNRFKEGSLNLDFPDLKILYDATGKPTELQRIENDISHQLIEEFMLVANEVVAKTLRDRAIPNIYRVHEDPDAEKLAEFRFQMQTFGLQIGDITVRRELQKFLESITGHPEEDSLKISLLKSLKKARYSTEPLGHFGLCKSNYCHFTSPIRRYSDLITHRQLLKYMGGGESGDKRYLSRMTISEMEKVADHISDTERIATEAERESIKLKQLEYLEELIRNHPGKKPPVFKVTVVDVKRFGLLAEIPEFLLTGLIHVSDLGADHFLFDPGYGGFVGKKSKIVYQIGSEIEVQIKKIDLIKKLVDFRVAERDG